MRDPNIRNHGNLTVIHGGTYARRPAMRLRSSDELELDERMRARFAACRSRVNTAPSRAVQEIIEGNHAPWRTTARRAMELLAAGVPVAAVQVACAMELNAWIAEQADKHPTPPATAAAMRKVA